MRVEVRVYKLFDIDIASLMNAGYPVAAMMKEAIISFAHGIPVKYYIDQDIFFDFSCKKSIHTAFDIPANDDVTIRLLKSIIKGYRNTFCKMIFRNSLVIQNLQGFIANQSFYFSSVKDTLLKSAELFHGDMKKLSELKEVHGTRVVLPKKPGGEKEKTTKDLSHTDTSVSAGSSAATKTIHSETNNTDVNTLLLQYIQNCMANGINPFEQMKQPETPADISPLLPSSPPTSSPAPLASQVNELSEDQPSDNDDLNNGIQVADDASILDMFDAL